MDKSVSLCVCLCKNARFCVYVCASTSGMRVCVCVKMKIVSSTSNSLRSLCASDSICARSSAS